MGLYSKDRSILIAILSPGFPSTPGGVTDHTHRLVGHWTAAGRTVRVIGDVALDPAEGVRELAASGVTGLLIQYVPFLYGRRGLSSYPERLARAAKTAGIRVTVFVHEPWVPMTRLPWLVLGPLQRRQLLRLVRVADRVITAVPAWRAALGPQTEVLYVGSNLGPVPPATSPTPLPAPVVFSPTAAGFRFGWIVAAARAIGAKPGLILIGTHAAEAPPHPDWDWRGRLPGPDALRIMAQARLMLAPFIDGATGRRTSLLAAVSSGARVISSGGPLLDPVFRDSPVLIANNEAEFVDLAVRTWNAPDAPAAREARLTWYGRHFEPAALDARLLRVVTGSP